MVTACRLRRMAKAATSGVTDVVGVASPLPSAFLMGVVGGCDAVSLPNLLPLRMAMAAASAGDGAVCGRCGSPADAGDTGVPPTVKPWPVA